MGAQKKMSFSLEFMKSGSKLAKIVTHIKTHQFTEFLVKYSGNKPERVRACPMRDRTVIMP